LQPPRPTMRPMSRSSTSISSVSPPRPFANVDIWNDETKLKTRICLSKAQGTFQNRITPKPQYIYIYWHTISQNVTALGQANTNQILHICKNMRQIRKTCPHVFCILNVYKTKKTYIHHTFNSEMFRSDGTPTLYLIGIAVIVCQGSELCWWTYMGRSCFS
jgi:hypothetical protein